MQLKPSGQENDAVAESGHGSHARQKDANKKKEKGNLEARACRPCREMALEFSHERGCQWDQWLDS